MAAAADRKRPIKPPLPRFERAPGLADRGIRWRRSANSPRLKQKWPGEGPGHFLLSKRDGEAQRDSTMNPVPFPVYEPRPLSEIVSELPGSSK